jgi:cell division transport system permease protein
MIEKVGTSMRSIKEAFKNLSRNLGVSLAAISIVVITLSLLGLSITGGIFVSKISTQAVDNLQIVVYISNDATEEQIKKLGADIQAVPNVANVEFSSKQQELEFAVSGYGDTGQELLTYFQDSNPLNNVFLVTVNDATNNLAQVANDIAQMEFVQSADYGSAGVDNFIKFVKIAQLACIIITLLLLFLSVFLISITINLAIEHRKNEIFIMKLVGATN